MIAAIRISFVSYIRARISYSGTNLNILIIYYVMKY